MNEVLYFGNFDAKNGFASVLRAYKISMLLANEGFKVYIPCINSSFFPLNNDGGVCLVERKAASKSVLYFDSKFYIDMLSKHPDTRIVFLYDFPSLPSFKILSYCKKRKIKVIGDVTEWFDSKCVSFAKKIPKSFDTSLRMNCVNFLLDGLICISKFLAKKYSKCKNVYTLPPLMDSITMDSICEHHLTRNHINICFAGHTNKSKDNIWDFCRYLVEHKVEDVYFNIYGNNEKLVKNFNCDYSKEHILIRGNLDHNSLIREMEHMNFQLILRNKSRANMAGYSTKFVESVMLGLPCILTNVGDLSELLPNNYSLIFEPKRIDYGIILEKIRDCNYLELVDAMKALRHLYFSEEYAASFSLFIKDVLEAKL